MDVMTENGKGDGDAKLLEGMLGQVESPIDRFGGDGVYDTHEIRRLLKEKEIEGIIPPQGNAIYWVDGFDELLDLDSNRDSKK